ncbi:MAG: SpoIIE family protein phosphatase [Bacteroidaceae bacterium]|nr:SpoIIE family protein phosphatase [Bacteroidaceae bacterium]
MKGSLAKRLTFHIMVVVMVMLTIITGFVYISVKDYMLDEAKERYLGILLTEREKVRRKLSDIYVATVNNVHDIERDIENPDLMLGQVGRIVNQNPTMVSCGVLFKPDYYPQKGRFYVPFASRDSLGTVHIERIDSIYTRYPDTEWYKDMMKRDRADWTGAYFEDPAISKYVQPRLLTTFSCPVHDRQQQPVALLCADLSLESMRIDLMAQMEVVNRKFEEGLRHKSYGFIIDKKGTYIIHPDEDLMLTANFHEQFKKASGYMDILKQMKKKDKGSAMMEVEGVTSWIYYRTIKFVDWTYVIVVPEDVIFHNGRMLNTLILLTMLFGLIAIYLICRHIIKQLTDPVTTQKAALERELKIARGIQMAMLPNDFLSQQENTDLDLYASLTPARDVGGDLYDYFVRDNRLFFCIGDVSGKGVPAALLMAVMRAMFRSEARRADKAADIVKTMNRNLGEESTSGYFVTMFVGILDLLTGHLDFCNAGHEPPLVSGQPLSINPNLPIGALSDWDYEGEETQLKVGDMLFLYTDGLTEAKDVEMQSMGRNCVVKLAQTHSNDTAQKLVELMEAEAHRHAGEAEQSDDITLLAFRWQGKTLKLKPDMDDIAKLKPFIFETAQSAGIDEKEANRLRLAVEEVLANVINYGEATGITLRASVENEQLMLTIDDDGQAFDPTQDSTTDLSVPPDHRPPGGLGLIFLHQMTDGLAYQYSNGHNILTIIKRITNGHHD